MKNDDMFTKEELRDVVRTHVLLGLDYVEAEVDAGNERYSGICTILYNYMRKQGEERVFGTCYGGYVCTVRGSHIVAFAMESAGDSYKWYSGNSEYPVAPPDELVHLPEEGEDWDDTPPEEEVFNRGILLWEGEYGERRRELLQWLKEFYADSVSSDKALRRIRLVPLL